jgi:hypothetical protein
MAGLHAMWWDNYSQVISHRAPTLLRGTWTGCLWTGMAAIKFFAGPDSTVTMELEMDGDGQVVWAMPRRITGYYTHILRMINEIARSSKEILRTSLCHRMKVNCVPLKPIAPPGDARLANLLAQSRDGIGNFYPDRILPHNIGSNVGLMNILKLFCDERDIYAIGGPGRYYMINCDINIYNRLLKVSLSLILMTL